MTDFSKATVIGENMDRVYKTADDLGIAAKELYKGFDNYEKLERSGKMGKCIAEVCGKTDNAVWITNKLRNNYKIIDIGADLSKGVHKLSKSCQVEHAAIKVWETRNIWKLSYHLPSLTK